MASRPAVTGVNDAAHELAGEGGYLLNEPSHLKQIAQAATEQALRAGVDQAIASAKENGGITMRARGGNFDNATREGSQALSIKVFVGGRTGEASTSALSPMAVERAVERAILIAHQVEPDSDSAPPELAWLGTDAVDVPLFAPSGLTAQDLGRIALEIESAANDAADVRVIEAGASSIDACLALAIGRDFSGVYRTSRQSLWCSVIAERNGMMAQDMWSDIDRRVAGLAAADEVGAKAAQRATRKVGGRPLSTTTAPVLLDATVAATLVAEMASALMGTAQVEGATYWHDMLGKQAVAGHIDLVEDPFEPYGLTSKPYDHEGVAGTARHVIRGGVLEGYFLNCLNARKLGTRSTGNADGCNNLTLSSRNAIATSPELLRQLDTGLWVTEFLGGSADPVTGNYSKAVAGFWVENGEVAFPVQDTTIAGELPQMLKELVTVGGDVYRRGAFRSGSILLNSMRISGR
ncbi:PmbA protein [Sphingomonas carotinifaciens]|nr:metallopeptidase TldD-related protein [Sphingomonas carotinifaciens]MBB4086943.1 PmbA protein [Sphingomonas carotinifaciens]SDF55953.1 PmbA protein [Sphingomonas carotinifaciens]